MREQTDAELLREYVSAGNEAAFGEIVRRHTDLKAVQVAPAGLAAAMTAASLSTASLAAPTVLSATMLIVQKGVAAAMIAGVIAGGFYQALKISNLRSDVVRLQAEQLRSADETQALERERSAATNQLAELAQQLESLRTNSAELLRLRNEAGVLRRELARAATRLDARTAGDSSQSWAAGRTIQPKLEKRGTRES